MFDPSIWRSRVSSFGYPTTPLISEPMAGPLVGLWINADWLNVLIGCAMQLSQPSVWNVSDSAELVTVMEQAAAVVTILGVAGQGTRRGPRPISNGDAYSTWLQNSIAGKYVLND